jgi:TRAP transporter TAXI family solute receptor
MAKLNTARVAPIILALVTLTVAGVGARAFHRNNTQVFNVNIAAGSARSESFVIMEALKAVVESRHPQIKVSVHETGGTTENLERLERGEAQFAAAQADVRAGQSARMVAILFEDTFQLLVHKDSNIKDFPDLKGKKIGVPKSGGQYKSFMFLAGHFGMRESDFNFVGGNDDAGDMSFARNEADGVFRVRSLHNAAIARLTSNGGVAFVPIRHAQSMRIEQPAFASAVIPEGTYLGNEPIPPADIPTVSVDRTLLARSDVDDTVIAAFLDVLMERRAQMADAINATDEAVRPLVVRSKRPPAHEGFLPNPHPASLAYFNRDPVSFIQNNEEVLAFLAVGIALLWAWVIVLKHWDRDRKSRYAERYKERIALLIDEAQSATSDRQLEPIRTELTEMMVTAIRLRHKLSEESFQSFHTVWKIAFDLIGAGSASADTRPVAVAATAQGGADPTEQPRSWWKFGR